MKTWCWRAAAASVGVAMMWVATSGVAAAATTKAAKANGGAEPSVTYAVRAGAAGEMVLTADAGVLQIEKSVFEDGRTSLVLKSDRDEVTIAFDRNGVTAVSGDSRATIKGAQPDEAAFGRTRALLAKSKAARLFRDLVAAIERRNQRPNAYEQLLFLTSSEVSRAEGDTTAVDVFARRIGARKAPGKPAGVGLQPVSCSGGMKRVQFTDCLTAYESALMGAYSRWGGCYSNVFNNVSWYWQYQELWLCDIEYYVRAETYAFQMMACMAIP